MADDLNRAGGTDAAGKAGSPHATGDGANVPEWLLRDEDYRPPRDRGGFVTRSILSLVGVLSRMRLDDGQSTPLSPSAPLKLALGLVLILLTSLSRNFLFVLVMLTLVLVRAALLPSRALARTASVALAAAGVTVLVMLPSTLMGQAHSMVLLGTKALVSTSIAMEVALSTPVHELTGALRSYHVPGTVVLTLDLALRSITDLGRVAVEVLTALRLRSVGRDPNKRGSIGGVGGVVLLKSGQAAQDTADAMACRCFDGSYEPPRQEASRHDTVHRRIVDAAWLLGTAALLVLFLYLQGLV